VTPRRHWDDQRDLGPGRRLFVAVPLPDEAVAAVSAVVDEVRAIELPTGMRDVRWVRRDGLHVTLRFLGPTAEDREEATAEAVRSAAVARAPIRASLEGAGAFPDPRRPRTIWIGIVDPLDAFAALAAAVDERLAEAGWGPSGRPFRAHLTLARSDGLPAGALVHTRLAAAMAGRRIEFVGDGLTLFESITGGGPARYVPVMTTPLGVTPEVGEAVYHRGNP